MINRKLKKITNRGKRDGCRVHTWISLVSQKNGFPLPFFSSSGSLPSRPSSLKLSPDPLSHGSSFSFPVFPPQPSPILCPSHVPSGRPIRLIPGVVRRLYTKKNNLSFLLSPEGGGLQLGFHAPGAQIPTLSPPHPRNSSPPHQSFSPSPFVLFSPSFLPFFIFFSFFWFVPSPFQVASHHRANLCDLRYWACFFAYRI